MFKRKLSIALVLIASLADGAPHAISQSLRQKNQPAEVHRDLIICLTDKAASNLGDASLSTVAQDLCARFGLELAKRPASGQISAQDASQMARTYSRRHLFAAIVPERNDPSEVLAALNRDPRVRYAETLAEIPVAPVAVSTAQRAVSITSDNRQYQWALSTMQVAPGLMANSRIGIIDTGCNASLAPIVDGRDFYNKCSDWTDTFGHGGHVASVISSETGALANAQLYALKCATPDGKINILAMSEAIDWGLEYGIRVFNCSFGASGPGWAPSQTQLEAIERAQDAGALIVAAAGNEDKTDVDVVDNIWNVPNSNVIRVAATMENGRLAPFSNVGHGRIDVAAPGLNVIFPDGSIGAGTSFSAPWVTALAALLLDQTTDWREVVSRIRDSVDLSDGLTAMVFSGGGLNYLRALTADLNAPLDELRIETLKLKKKKKLSLTAMIVPTMPLSSVFPVVRIYANDILLGFGERDETGVYSFFAKGKFPDGTTIILLSSGGGRVSWTNSQAQASAAPLRSLSPGFAPAPMVMQYGQSGS